VAGAVAPTNPRRTLAYEPVHPWITGMAVAEFETRRRRSAGHAGVTRANLEGIMAEFAAFELDELEQSRPR
jgi:hypothetical protein